MKTNAECFYETLSWVQKLSPGDAVMLEAELVVGAGNFLAQDANWPPHLRGADSAIHYFEREGNLTMVPHLVGEHSELYYVLRRKKRARHCPRQPLAMFTRNHAPLSE